MLTETTTSYRLAVDAPGASDAQRAESDALASAVRSHGVRHFAVTSYGNSCAIGLFDRGVAGFDRTTSMEVIQFRGFVLRVGRI